ncbi:LysR family transcriptional regulator [Rhizobium sp. L1K21]|uniref:LysR family transcriptional regulator n=1 Tax=Rhizobium sp. L1K21 TaxID=2954933 RepID=UPI0020920BB2|nr:LysR family transcriptional regulator [Rhizobium sp. L1K21]MCO6187086.1 LysR family transcriptional regulator [Rhizobium sp. L1K21]
MKELPWDLYQHFLAVARHGGLSGAAGELGVSSATMGRKILELEQRTGETFFHRAQTGYRLTAAGKILHATLQEMESAVRKVCILHAETTALARVRIMAGTWNTAFMTDNIGAICTENDPFLIDFNTTEERARVAHRESDIGIRAFKPDEPNLAARKLPDAAYGIYRSRNARVPDNRWIAISEENAISTYLRWPHENRKREIAFTVNRAASLRDLIVSGAGLGVLPCICGEREPGLERVGFVEGFVHEQWLVMHQDDRHRPEIRTVINRIVRLFKSHADIMTGRSGSASAK